ncbi:uncharacterized protein LOC143027483 [Oratosquilla oratoria]|uniref:uncharacterized protein LOC143027483 n=1 Tax=Oratosquilla oratoria TaxID=337810 RepID=UPI003F777B2F
MELDEIRHALNQFVSYNQNIMDRISRARKDAEDSRNHVDQLIKQQATLIQNRSRFLQEIQAIREQMTVNTGKIASLRKEIVAAEVEGDLLENRLREFETRSEGLFQGVTDMYSQINDWKERAQKYDSEQPEYKEFEVLRQSFQRLERCKKALKKQLEIGTAPWGTGRSPKSGQKDAGAKTTWELEQDKLRLQLKKEEVLRERNARKYSHEDLRRQLAALQADLLVYEDRNRQVRGQLIRQVTYLRSRKNSLRQELVVLSHQ